MHALFAIQNMPFRPNSGQTTPAHTAQSLRHLVGASPAILSINEYSDTPSALINRLKKQTFRIQRATLCPTRTLPTQVMQVLNHATYTLLWHQRVGNPWPAENLAGGYRGESHINGSATLHLLSHRSLTSLPGDRPVSSSSQSCRQKIRRHGIKSPMKFDDPESPALHAHRLLADVLCTVPSSIGSTTYQDSKVGKPVARTHGI